MMETKNEVLKHTISLYVANKPGVLIRISLVFARRGYNIDSLVVSEAHDPNFSRMSIMATGDKKTLDQILKQLNKLVDVVYAHDNTGEDIIQRELALIKVKANADTRAEILQIAHAFDAETVDVSENAVTFQVTGKTEKIDSSQKILEKYGIIESVRTGKILMSRGDKEE